MKPEKKPLMRRIEELFMGPRPPCGEVGYRFASFGTYRFVCTITRGHSGDHVAEGREGQVCHSWPRS